MHSKSQKGSGNLEDHPEYQHKGWGKNGTVEGVAVVQ